MHNQQSQCKSGNKPISCPALKGKRNRRRVQTGPNVLPQGERPDGSCPALKGKKECQPATGCNGPKPDRKTETGILRSMKHTVTARSGNRQTGRSTACGPKKSEKEMNQFGHTFRLSLWGESHGPQIGITLDGIPAGIPLSEADFETDLARRRSGATGTTPRREADLPHIVSGLYEGKTTGAPLTVAFTNENTRSQDYASLTQHCRPSHADRVAACKFSGFNDPRGGGHFSARLTLGLTAAGVVAKKILPQQIRFSTHLAEIGGCTDPERFDEVLRAAIADRDSVGGVVECRVEGLPTGWGDPFFDSAESMIAHLLFSVPAVKGVEFGSGFSGARRRGSENNDRIADAEGRTFSNNAGGIDGGLTNGNELVVRAALKPTPSIGRPQMTYNRATNRVEALEIRGRHDACVALRGAVVVEAAVAVALADLSRR